MTNICISTADNSEFWLNWSVNFGTAIFTLAAVLVAMFGEKLKAKFFKPRLTLELENNHGEMTMITLEWQTTDGMQRRTEEARYYHLVVRNERKWPSSTQTQVFLKQIEQPGPDGVLQIKWTGELPIQWTHQSLYPIARTIGPAATCDICSVVKGKWFQFHPLLVPNNFQLHYRDPCTVVASFLIKGNEGESKIYRFQLSWDGKWADGNQEMSQHFVIKDISQN